MKVTVVNDNKVIREEHGPNYSVTITNEVNGNELHQVRIHEFTKITLFNYVSRHRSVNTLLFSVYI